jgi:hypothetical protein
MQYYQAVISQTRIFWSCALVSLPLLGAGCAASGDTAATPQRLADAAIDALGDASEAVDAGDGTAADAQGDSPVESAEAGACVPKSCQQLYAECGTAPDGCAGTVFCGNCPAGQSCGGGGPNQCGTQSCQAKTCAQLGASCGWVSDGCSVALDCGACPAGTTCDEQHKCACTCSLAHATAVCSDGTCTIASCDSGYGDCDGAALNGCEVDLNHTTAHCGACGKACAGPLSCDGAGNCACDAALPADWPSLAPWSRNPALLATSAVALQGADNVYAPDIHALNGSLIMFYGAQGTDGHDRIYAAWSRDGAEWRKYPSDENPQPVLDHGGSNHVNDPSVVRQAGSWRMYYTDAPTAENDRIWLAQSSKPTGFQKVQQVLGPVAGTWEADKVGRPSVLLEGGVYKMWYDGSGAGGRHVGFASSSDGINFTRYAGNPIFLHAGAIDVKKVGGVYVMVREAGDGTLWATSTDGLCWVDRGKLFGLSGKSYDAFGQVTPFLQVEGSALRGVWFGGAAASTWNKNRIAVAWASGAGAATGGGCTRCTTAGWSCSAACQQAGAGALGVCGAPGSVNPGVCCACSAEGCEACVAGGCHQACVAAGRLGGWCGVPGSVDPGNCCTCL